MKNLEESIRSNQPSCESSDPISFNEFWLCLVAAKPWKPWKESHKYPNNAKRLWIISQSSIIIIFAQFLSISYSAGKCALKRIPQITPPFWEGSPDLMKNLDRYYSIHMGVSKLEPLKSLKKVDFVRNSMAFPKAPPSFEIRRHGVSYVRLLHVTSVQGSHRGEAFEFHQVIAIIGNQWKWL